MLQDLNKLIAPIKERIDNFYSLDCEIPESFKSAVRCIKNDKIQYGQFSSCITNRNGQHIYISNNWFYIAAILSPLYKPFNQYKDLISKTVDKETLTKNNTELITLKINQKTDIEPQDKEYLIKFATDSRWWNGGNSSTGGKKLQRGDALTSAVLSIANLVNNSHNYIATIWEFLGKHPEYAQLLDNKSQNNDANQALPLQKIYYGSPGTGKSRAVNDHIGEQKAEAIRTTFHPDSDYASFVGAYKPVMEVVGEKKQIAYKFVKQAFLKAYIKAWQKFAEAESLDNIALQYLVIEEINRGNCAQIFGDLFQLLDRNDSGYSEYPIEADEDLAASLAEVESENNPSFGPGGLKLKGFKMEKLIDQYKKTNGEEEANAIAKDICVGKRLAFPPNLHILATMNTSDQSLFPMDSAFKRRWEWKYVPINYSKEIDSAKYKINIDYKGKTFTFSWIDFLKEVNERIKSTTDSEDKQMGNFFIKHSIDADEFKGKVMFYLWSEICKEEYHNQERNFMQRVSVNEGDKDLTEEIEKRIEELKKDFGDKKKEKFFIANLSEFGPEEFSFNELYDDREKGNGILLGFMYGLGLLPEDKTVTPKDDNGQQDNPDGQDSGASTGIKGQAEDNPDCKDTNPEDQSEDNPEPQA